MKRNLNKLTQAERDAAQITILKAPNMGQPEENAWQYRVIVSRFHNWSGSAPTRDEAWRRAKELLDGL